MSQIAKISTKMEIKSPSEKFYDFYKNNFTQISNVNPQVVKRCELIEGEESQVGNVKLFEYVLMGKTMTAKLKTVVIDDKEKTVGFEAIEGELLQFYPSFKSRITMSEEGRVEMTIEYEKANESVPNADPYAKFAEGVVKVLDAYLLNH